MKKLLSLIFSAYMVLSLSACGNIQNTEKMETSQAMPEVQTQMAAPVAETEKPESVSDNNLTVNYIDAGQGDSEFIELPNGETMLIDAGNPNNVSGIVRHIRDKGYSILNYVVATHPHSDHIGGMALVLDNFEVGKIYMPKKEHTSRTFENLLDMIESNNIELHTAKAGVNILDTTDLKIDILAPISNSYSDLNDYSAVVKITYKDNSFLFMGDAENIVENELLNSNADLKADVLKVGHHGSSYSSSQAFIKAVSPKYAIISCGANNQYRHPHSETLATLNSFNINTYRTDEVGTIVVISDGVNITVNKKASTVKENAPPVLTEKVQQKENNTSSASSQTVYVTKSGSKYHNLGCQYLKSSQIKISLQDAKSRGYEPCGKCLPPR